MMPARISAITRGCFSLWRPAASTRVVAMMITTCSRKSPTAESKGSAPFRKPPLASVCAGCCGSALATMVPGRQQTGAA